MLARTTVLVAFGGGLGSLARYGISRALAGGFPVATLLINLTGAFLLGLLVALVARRDAHPLVRPFFGTGVLGGYTTFSTFALDSRGLGAAAEVGYVAATLIGGVVLAFAGLRLGRPRVPTGIDPELP